MESGSSAQRAKIFAARSTDGVTGRGMPAYSQKLTNAEITELMAYIRKREQAR